MTVTDTPRLNIKKLGELLKKERIDRDITVVRLARILMISPMAIYKWEKGLSAPTLDNLIRLAFIMEFSIDDLLYQSSDGVLEDAQ